MIENNLRERSQEESAHSRRKAELKKMKMNLKAELQQEEREAEEEIKNLKVLQQPNPRKSQAPHAYCHTPLVFPSAGNRAQGDDEAARGIRPQSQTA